MKNIVLFVLIIVASNMIGNIKAEVCNRYTGPDGAKICIKLANYNDLQWATCRTDTYLTLKSGGSHGCQDSATYCYYQCMLEKHHAESGDVLGSCRCSSAESHKAKLYNLPFVCFVVLVTNYLFVS